MDQHPRIWLPEQIGYQKESPSVRNSFLAAAFELRHGFPSGSISQPVNPDRVRAISTEFFLDFLAIRVDGKKEKGMAFVINLFTPTARASKPAIQIFRSRSTGAIWSRS
jgi:alkyl sulfatase BDS1-like metallo-beta-lactamase superfamily hydrolase